MIKKILWGVGILVILFSLYVLYILLTTKSHSPADTLTFSNGTVNISLDYCRPFKKGRVIFGGLVPYDTYWRTGANEATEIRFSADVQFGDKIAKAGEYRIYTIPGKEEWTVVLNSELGKWGAYEPDYDLDVLRIKVPAQKTTSEVEQFKIDLVETAGGVDLTMAWDDTKIAIPIKI